MCSRFGVFPFWRVPSLANCQLPIAQSHPLALPIANCQLLIAQSHPPAPALTTFVRDFASLNLPIAKSEEENRLFSRYDTFFMLSQLAFQLFSKMEIAIFVLHTVQLRLYRCGPHQPFQSLPRRIGEAGAWEGKRQNRSWLGMNNQRPICRPSK
jgi:hypothetical protein